MLSIVTTSLVFFLGGIFSTADAQISAVERAALVALFNSTNGDNWMDNSGWKQHPLHMDGCAMPGTEGTWHGITLHAEQTAVERIVLGQNGLNGPIPTELGNLSNLVDLYLQNNQLQEAGRAALHQVFPPLGSRLARKETN